MAPGNDDERHKREEAERRAKRKASKKNLSAAALEKERKRKAHAQKILGKQGGSGDSKRQKTAAAVEDTKSAFQEIFAQRAQGFQIDFRFRNAPPRPPVGPNFVGSGLDGALLDCSQYRPMNAVEVNYKWRLHNEPDLGVPLAPSAMDPKSYIPTKVQPALHPDDENLLDWKGSLGDTAADELKRRKDNARAAARLALMGKSPSALLDKAKSPVSTSASSKKAFSRVLDESMQSWMKKTTYLSNDYSRKVHDFKSLAKTKEQLAQDLEVKQKQIYKNRSPSAIAESFKQNTVPVLKHPTKPNLKPVMEMPLLPNVQEWGHSYTHVVMDKTPGDEDKLSKAFIANVQKRDDNAKMTCQIFVPSDDNETSASSYQAIQQYELDVLPLKEEDAPHVNFCIWIDPGSKKASYTPISSRVQLSTGRPIKKKNFSMEIRRREMDEADIREMDEQLAEVDSDIAERVKASLVSSSAARANGETADKTAPPAAPGKDDDDDDDDDDGLDDDDDDSDDDSVPDFKPKSSSTPIVAEG